MDERFCIQGEYVQYADGAKRIASEVEKQLWNALVDFWGPIDLFDPALSVLDWPIISEARGIDLPAFARLARAAREKMRTEECQ